MTMNFRGLTKFTLADYPAKIACVAYVGGCNFRCPYCHNPGLACAPDSYPEISDEMLLDFLASRKGKLDGVVISGGEPTLRPALPNFAANVKRMGFLLKLDTNGSFPKTIEALWESGHLDSLGVDFKAPTAKFMEVARPLSRFACAADVSTTLSFAVKAGIPLDCRTTVHRDLLSEDDLRLMRAELDALGVGEWFLQQFNPVEIIDGTLLKRPTFTNSELLAIADSLPRTRVRGIS